MALTRHNRGGMIIMTFVVALILTMVPLPSWVALLRPEWVAIVLIYWCMALPQRIGVGVGWTVGILLDVMRGALLGQHALGLAVVAYLSGKLHQQIRVYPPWQQALSVLVLVILYQALVLWVKGIIGQPPQNWAYWLPSLSSMLLWPWTFLFLRKIRRHFRVS